MQLYGTIYAAKTKREWAAQKHFALPLVYHFLVVFLPPLTSALGGLGLKPGRSTLPFTGGFLPVGAGFLGGGRCDQWDGAARRGSDTWGRSR